ncbi:MAG: hypothetical protein AAGF81_12190 [Pseudomonadota bacterium]
MTEKGCYDGHMSDNTIKEPSEAHKSSDRLLKREIGRGFEQIDRGDAVTLDKKAFDQLREEIDKGIRSKSD